MTLAAMRTSLNQLISKLCGNTSLLSASSRRLRSSEKAQNDMKRHFFRRLEIMERERGSSFFQFSFVIFF
jgi:hypothetical protein